MAKKVAPVPKGYRTVTPSLVVAGADAALAFYADVFGAETLSRIYADDMTTVLHAEMKIGNSIVIVSDQMPAFGIYAPFAYGGSAVTQHIYIADVDSVFEKAVEAGCGVLVPLADTAYGERYGKIVDPFGHVWSMSKRIPAPKAETVKAQAEAHGIAAVETAGGYAEGTSEPALEPGAIEAA